MDLNFLMLQQTQTLKTILFTEHLPTPGTAVGPRDSEEN